MRLWIVAARVAFAPDRATFLRFDCTPTTGQCSRTDDKIAAGFRFKRFFCRPDIVLESRVLKEKAVAILPDHRCIVADFPVDDGRDDKRRAFLAEGHLVIEANLFREFRHLRQ